MKKKEKNVNLNQSVIFHAVLHYIENYIQGKILLVDSTGERTNGNKTHD